MDCEGGVCAISIDNITAPVMEDMELMRMNLRDIVGRKNPLLLAAADQIFGAGGKRLRPVLVFLVARATAQLMALDDITDRQRRLAEITEMIHTASLVHDDVLDDCDTRRGAETIHTLYGTRVAILAGDFLFAQSSWYLANLDNLEVIKLISQVIADFADGEISQAGALYNCDVTLEQYLEKSHNKTASLIAASCKSAAVFSGVEESVKVDMYEYGKHLGLAFQVVDDILDFTQSEEQLGKPQGQDLATGNLTAPTLFALSRAPELRGMIESRFEKDGDLARAIDIVNEHGIEDARRLAREEADVALSSLKGLPEGEAKESLQGMVEYVLERIY
jgi:all-trans-nonaprenyl-diphosphate synthase